MSSLTKGKLSSGLDQFSLSLASGTLTLNDADGNTISSSNPVQIKLRHTDGTLKTYMITTSFTFRDDANATKSDFLNSGSTDGMEFGRTAVTVWGNALPVCIGWIHDGTTAYPAHTFMPDYRSTGAATNIGYKEVKAATASDDNIVAWTTTDITTSHANKMFIPFATCTATMTTAEDWTFALTGTSGDGVGEFCLDMNFGTREYDNVTGHFGASSGGFILPNGGTAPSMSTQTYKFKINRNRKVDIQSYLDGDGGTDGSGAVAAFMTIPYKFKGNGVNVKYASCLVQTAGALYLGIFRPYNNLNYGDFYVTTSTTAITQMPLGNFTNGNRTLAVDASYWAA